MTTSKYLEEEINSPLVISCKWRSFSYRTPQQTPPCSSHCPVEWCVNSVTMPITGAWGTLIGWGLGSWTSHCQEGGIAMVAKPTSAHLQHWYSSNCIATKKCRWSEESGLMVKKKTTMSVRDSLQMFLKKQRPSCHVHFLLDHCHEVLTHFKLYHSPWFLLFLC